jgi:RNA polymerase sigma-70 factor, ECF subfamily
MNAAVMSSFPLLRWPGALLASRFEATRLDGGGAAVKDEELVASAGRGDRTAFEELYRRHVKMVWSRLTHLIGPDPEREDLTQQIFMELFHGLQKFRGEASFRTYLARIVVNTAYDHLRKRGGRPRMLPAEAFEMVEAPSSSPEKKAEARQRCELVWSLLEKIKPKKRVAFVLRMVEGLSLSEIGELVDANEATVAQRIRHAQQELESMLNRRGGES